MSTDSVLPFGSYETPVTASVAKRIEETRKQFPAAGFGVASGESTGNRARYSSAITHYIARQLERRLAETSDTDDRVALLNTVLNTLEAGESIRAEQLLYSVQETDNATPPQLPEVPLTQEALFTNAPGEVSLNNEVARELRTADEVDLLCAFIKQSGLAVIADNLRELQDRGVPFRVITSTYCGATEATALRRLVEDFGAEVRVCYESNQTRLHAKAWMFRRNSGFDTAFIGSSNLSQSALVDGMEWNVRTTSTTTPGVLDKFLSTFDTYWHSDQFKQFDPSRDERTLLDALDAASWNSSKTLQPLELSGLRAEPYTYQKEMLEALTSERLEHDRHRNLLVAATGTGKTVVAAFDYRDLSKARGKRPRLLFVAHRVEILQQSLRTFREILGTTDFGEILNGDHKPREWSHVFASVQSLKRDTLNKLSPDHFDIIIIDEFHHAEATTYQRVLEHFTLQELLGLTATPERGDGKNVLSYFDYRAAYELRLWDALALQLLCPIHYYGVDDGTDLSSLTWRRGTKDYDQQELSDFYIKAGEKRIKFILSQMVNKLYDLSTVKGIGFCVSVEHAHYMAQEFSRFGVTATAVDGSTPSKQRQAALDQLANGDIHFIFAVDLFNEGVDIPEVNTLLLLRPTQSPVIFLQQLGRGLRLQEGKDACTVFDFIGVQHQNFDFEARYTALSGKRGKHLMKEIESGFPTAPPGTSIKFDRVAADRVLRNIRKVTSGNKRRISALTKEVGTTDLRAFLDESGFDIVDVYKSNGSSWTRYLRDAGLLPQPSDHSSVEKMLLSRIPAFLHVNDHARAEAYRRILNDSSLDTRKLTHADRLYARMLIFNVWGPSIKQSPASEAEAVDILRSYPQFVSELTQVLNLVEDSSRIVPALLDEAIGQGVLYTHASYSLGELIAVLDNQPLSQINGLPREGVKHFEHLSTDLLLVTLVKDTSVSKSTNYHDYPISESLFHWETQSNQAEHHKTVQRYINHKNKGDSILLATRGEKTNELDLAEPYTLLGKADYVSHRGSKPVAINWQLQRKMPTKLYRIGRTVA